MWKHFGSADIKKSAVWAFLTVRGDLGKAFYYVIITY